ncbi:D-alanyl-D-alanine carboxypeptidase family protein [Fodinicurvata fenggangensis]|uniref:D-alanyl-D-alanine carboxypeptidase family protein n=1 Tax=Fodinicurvata fenggangensis TaxID=1121830 RepID=UPI000691A45B|nr:D-alanyl-D-alanine carboxypeptidase family protein [Fodinicurvata fenggangensis]
MPALPRYVAFVSGLLLLSIACVPLAKAFETEAREAILVDHETGSILYEKQADKAMPPASMSKIMTAYMVFDRLEEERLSMDDKLPVSEKAWRKGGSKMFVEVGEEVAVSDLLRGVIVQSGNDACIVLAEGISGSEEAFAREMTEMGREIGLQDSTFANATGWPHPDHRMSARDLATLARRIIDEFPQYYEIYSETEFTWNEIRQGNRNPLLYRNIGADGLKTGHTEEAGYGLTASAVQDGRRLVLVVTGLDSVNERAEEASRLLSWGFREFDNFNLAEKDEPIDEATVWLGAEDTVPLVAEDELVVTLPHAARDELEARIVYEGPVPAPIEKGQTIGTLILSAPGMPEQEIPLLAAKDVDKAGLFGRLFAAGKYLVLGNP